MNGFIVFKNKPRIISVATVCGKKEGAGNLGKYVDEIITDDYCGEKSFEFAERKMLEKTIKKVIDKANMVEDEIGVYIGGDLLDQIISSSFSARQLPIPFLGVYTACSTMGESMLLGAILTDGGYLKNALCATCSHFSTAERQYRFPLEQGTTRPAQSQWTVTGAGGNLISLDGDGIKIISALIGKVIDYGVTDANNMGAAMAPDIGIIGI